MTLQISIISHNINGTKNKDAYIDDLYENFDVICLQETLLLPLAEISFIEALFIRFLLLMLLPRVAALLEAWPVF